MSILGTVIGCVLALPVAILSSSNINKSIPVVWLIRFLLGPPDTADSDHRTRVRADLLARHVFRHHRNRHLYLWYRGQNAL